MSDSPVGLPPDDFFRLCYDDLRRLAARRLASERPGQTLQPTALVHEIYLRMAASELPLHFPTRGHFLAFAAMKLRQVLIDEARRKAPRNRVGRDRRPVDLDQLAADPISRPLELLDLDAALARLADHSPRRADLVRLRFFAGLTVPEAAEALGVSVATAERWWTYSRAWLLAEMSKPDEGPPADPSL
jgi:RNA polymerase sigma factor (TIGR02999 family)